MADTVAACRHGRVMSCEDRGKAYVAQVIEEKTLVSVRGLHEKQAAMFGSILVRERRTR